MSKLHSALASSGFHSGDEDIEDWYFGPSTQSALLTFQVAPLLKSEIIDAQLFHRWGCFFFLLLLLLHCCNKCLKTAQLLKVWVRNIHALSIHFPTK